LNSGWLSKNFYINYTKNSLAYTVDVMKDAESEYENPAPNG